MKVYFISGLGADRRVFKNIHLPPGYEIVYLDWIPPLRNEPLKEYALRLATAIDHSQPFAVVGLSLGGMMATEIALNSRPAVTIIISSIPLATQLPFYYRFMGMLGLHKIVPITLIKSFAILERLFGAHRITDKRILSQMLQETDHVFIRWAMSAVLKWKNQQYPDPYIHIHGSADKILPMRYTKPTHIIKGGGHALILNRAHKVNEILTNCFSHIQ